MLLFITLFLIPWMKILSYRFNLSHRKVFFRCSVFISYQSSVLALFVGEITKFYRFKVRVTLLWCFLLWCFKTYWLSLSRQSQLLPWEWKLARRFFLWYCFITISCLSLIRFSWRAKNAVVKVCLFLMNTTSVLTIEFWVSQLWPLFIVCKLVCLLLLSLFFCPLHD